MKLLRGVAFPLIGAAAMGTRSSLDAVRNLFIKRARGAVLPGLLQPSPELEDR